jgi:hypothetical protein
MMKVEAQYAGFESEVAVSHLCFKLWSSPYDATVLIVTEQSSNKTTTLSWRGGLHASMTQSSMLAGA